MHRVVEKMGAAAVDEEDELLLVFWRLAGGAVAALVVPVVCSVPLVDIFLKRGGLVVVLVSGPKFLLPKRSAAPLPTTRINPARNHHPTFHLLYHPTFRLFYPITHQF